MLDDSNSIFIFQRVIGIKNESRWWYVLAIFPFLSNVVSLPVPSFLTVCLETVPSLLNLSVLIVPYLSVTKGFLQGHKYIAPTSMSQIIEQIINWIRINSLTKVRAFLIKSLDKNQ